MRATKQPMAEPDLWSQPSTGIQWQAPSVPVETSEIAAAKQTDTAQGRERRETQQRRILELLASRESGYTRDELAAATGLPINVVCVRVSDLDARGYVDRTSDLTRPTRTKSPAKVLFITPAGRAFLAKREAA